MSALHRFHCFFVGLAAIAFLAATASAQLPNPKIPGLSPKTPSWKLPPGTSRPLIDPSKLAKPPVVSPKVPAPLQYVNVTVVLKNPQESPIDVEATIYLPGGGERTQRVRAVTGLSTPDDDLDLEAVFQIPRGGGANISVVTPSRLGSWSPHRAPVLVPANATRVNPVTITFRRTDRALTGTPLKVITFNAQFLPGIVGTFKNNREAADYRRAEIARQLNAGGYDVIALQELFDDDDREALISNLRRLWAASGKTMHRYGPPDESDLDQDGGVVILSRYPIVARHQTVFRESAGADYFANKGVLHARIAMAEGSANTIDVFATHLQASGADVRRSQVSQMRDFIARHSDPNRPFIVLGDFNIRGNPADVDNRDSEYNRMMNILRGARSTVQDAWRLLDHSLGATDNPLNPSSGKRIDYQLLGNLPGTPAHSLVPRTIRVNHFLDSRVRSLSDHSALEAIYSWNHP